MSTLPAVLSFDLLLTQLSSEKLVMSQISPRCECTAAFLSAAQLTIFPFAFLHLQAWATEHFRYGLDSVI